MRSMLALAKRNCLCFFRDKQSVLFSMMAALIVLLLYLLFLRDNLVGAYPSLPGMDNFVDVWVMSGLIAVVSVTSCAGALQTMVADRIEGRDMDILVTPMNPYKVALGHILSTFVCGYMMSMIVFAAGLVYLFATGCPLTAKGIVLTIILAIPAAFSGCTIMYAITSLIKSVGAFSGMFTTVSVLIGFVTGIYMPIRTMPAPIGTVSVFIPATQMASVLRDALAGSALDGLGMSGPALEDFRAELGFDTSIGGFQFTPAISILYTMAVALVFFLISVMLVKRRQ